MRSSEAPSVIRLPSKPVARRRRETEFLPAALEIIETPASPVGRAIAGTIIAFVCGALLWMTFGQIDIIATASGRIIPTGKSKVIQPFDTGVVRAIAVHDGEQVKVGDVLVELDPTSDASDEKRLSYALAQDDLDVARLRALLDGKRDTFAPSLGADARMIEVARDEMAAQQAERDAKVETVDRQIAQKEAESREVAAAIAKIQSSLPLLSEQRDIRDKLLANQYGSRLAYLQVQQQVVEGQHELEAQTQRREEVTQALGGLRHQREQIDAEFRKGLLTDLAKAEVQASEHTEEIAKSAMKRQLRTLRAPVAGTVQQLSVHTVGGVVTPAQQLMVIVPDGAGLEIEATLPNRDIGFVHRGQPVAIKVETFTFTRYGLLHGHVVSVSQDAVAPDATEERGQRRGDGGARDEAEHASGQPSYVARIALDERGVRTEQGFVDLEPGMSVTAEIKTGRRRIIDYLLSPLQRLSSESFKER